jgi:hypothetical protein
VTRLRALGLNLALAISAVALVVGVAEAALRVFPRLLPKGTYGASQYRSELMSSVYGDTVVYNKVRFVVRGDFNPGSVGIVLEDSATQVKQVQ